MTKHFPGGGPQLDGEDPHFDYGREQVYPGVTASIITCRLLKLLLTAGTAMIMPYYGMPMGTEHEEVGFAFQQGHHHRTCCAISTALTALSAPTGVTLDRRRILWARTFPARAWGVERLSLPERIVKSLVAGIDQFGGEACPEELVELVRSGRSQRGASGYQRAPSAARQVSAWDLFENRYVNEDAAANIAGNAAFRAAGELAQRKSVVLLKNAGQLPLRGRPKTLR